jgi:hypothetical protein
MHDVAVEEAVDAGLTERAAERGEYLREGTTMALYVAVVLIAELAALPEQDLHGDVVKGPTGNALLAIIWGTALGLAIAHIFAFRVAGPAFRGDLGRSNPRVALAHLGGAVFVSALSSIPVLLLDGPLEREGSSNVDTIIIGFIAFAVARSTGKSKLQASFYAITAVVLGLLVAQLKNTLAGH